MPMPLGGSISPAIRLQRFHDSYEPEPNTGCWIWIGSRGKREYGRAFIGHSHTTAHRWAYGLLIGPVPDEFDVCHRCDNPPCVNPAHLFLGTNLDNVFDRQRKGRSGIKLTAQDVVTIVELERAGESQGSIARQFNITQSNVSRIVGGHTWNGVDHVAR